MMKCECYFHENINFVAFQAVRMWSCQIEIGVKKKQV